MFFKKLKKYFFKKINQTASSHICDDDVADLSLTLAKTIAPRIIHFAKISKNSHPSNLTKEEWGIILKKMSDSFEWFSEERNHTKIQESAAHLEGIELFSKHYLNLRHSND
jgi:hypothetical protein